MRYHDNDAVPFSAQLLSRYVSYASVTGNEREAGLFFSGTAREKGFFVEILTDEPSSFNFTASLYPLAMKKPNIIFLNHIDVVPADDNGNYTWPPFSGVVSDGYVWGRGAIDNKGMAVMQFLALARYVESAGKTDLPFNFTMLSVSGEETGGLTGARIISEKYIDHLNPVAIYGEGGLGVPGALPGHPERKVFGISGTFKRSLWIELTLRLNTYGHGAVPPDSYVIRDKIMALYRLLNSNREIRFSGYTKNMFYELGKLKGGLRGFVLRNVNLFRPLVVPALKREDIIYSLISNTVTVTAINTPECPPNQIPQEITATLDCRLLPEIETEEFLKRIKKILGNEEVQIRIIFEDIKAPPTQIGDYYYYLKQALQEVYPGSEVLPILSPARNDNNYFRIHGIPTYGILPIFEPLYLLESVHNVDERIPVTALEQGLAVYEKLIGIILASAAEKSEI